MESLESKINSINEEDDIDIYDLMSKAQRNPRTE